MSKRPFNITRESYNLDISSEYTAVDWAGFLGPISTVWRKFTNESTTKIEHPHFLVGLMLDGWSDLAAGIKIFTRIAGPAVAIGLGGPAGLVYTLLAGQFTEISVLLHDAATGKNKDSLAGGGVDKTVDLIKKQKESIKLNIYKDLIINARKVEPEDYEKLRAEFNLFKTLIRGIKKEVMKPCKERKLGVQEIEMMKLFKPDKAANEMKNAAKILKEKDKKLGKLADEVCEFISKEIIQFTEKNVYVD